MKLKIALGYTALCLIWGTTYLALKIGLEGFAPFHLAAVRFLIAAAIMTPVLFRRRAHFSRDRREWIAIVVSGACMLVGANGLVTWSEVYLDSGLTALTVATNPVWAALIGGWLFARDERMSRMALIGAGLAMAGVYVLHSDRFSLGHAELPGVIGACVAPLFWSVGSLISRKYVKETDILSVSVMQMWIAAMLLFPISAALGESWDFTLTPRVIASMIFLITLGSALVYAVYVWLLTHLPASRVTTYTYVNPLVAILLGYLVLNEPISIEFLPATILIMSGLLLVYFSKNKSPSTPILRPRRKSKLLQPQS
jgi:drug/metabolite transporter (DMT)-like permease